MRNLLLTGVSACVVLFAACGGDEEQSRSTATPSAVETRRAPASPRVPPTARPSPGVTRPNPDTLIPAGYELDKFLDVSLDGSETGHIVVISHTIRKDKQGEPVVSDVPEECPDNTVLGGESSPCAFRFEVFAFDPASGWESIYVEGGAHPKQGSVFADGITQAVEGTAFGPSAAKPRALVLTYVNCGTSNCPVAGHLVLTMKAGQIARVFGAFEASFQIQNGSAIFNASEYAPEDSLCCPSARRITTVGLDPATDEIAVLNAEIQPINP